MKSPFKFLLLPYRRKKLLVKSLFLVVSVRVALWVMPFERVSSWLGGADLPESKGRPSDWDAIREAAACVRLCSQFVPRATCLTQALATRSLLHSMRLNSSLKIGVDKDANQKFIAHAWIEVEDKIIIGRTPDIRRYSIMSHNTEQLV